jgi:hypothetical protein
MQSKNMRFDKNASEQSVAGQSVKMAAQDKEDTSGVLLKSEAASVEYNFKHKA